MSPTAGHRTDKNRLSLIFRKRASTSETALAEKATAAARLNGSTDTSYRLGESRLLEGEPSGVSGGGTLSPGDRPDTRQSNDSAGESVRSRVGSVKKRLSLLTMGMQKKPSKASMMGQEAVREED